MNSPAQWAQIHSQEFLFENGCWKTCSSFCCTNCHPDFDFDLVPMQNATTILYMGPEYRWLAEHGQVFRNTAGRETAVRRDFDFGGPKPISMYHATCRLLGACSGVINKPFLCRVYPFFPVLSHAGELEDVYPSTIFDLTFDLLKIPTPCTVVGKRNLYINKWRNNPAMMASLNHPTVIFYLRAVKHFIDNYSAQLRNHQKLLALSGKPFWRAWEREYLTGNLINSSELKSAILADFQLLTARYGAFEL